MKATLPVVTTRVAALGLVLLLAYFALVSVVRPLRSPYPWSDFVTFYSAAAAFRAGDDPYADTLSASTPDDYAGWVGRYYYPPPFAALAVRPLLWLPFDAARRLWVLLEATAYVLAGLLLARSFGTGSRRRDLLAVGVLFLPYAPMTLDLRLGSVSGVLLLLVCVFLHERQRGHTTRAALALGAAILLKLSPALVAVTLLVRGERRLFLRTLASVVALVLVALPWTGLHAYRTYAFETLPFLASANFSWFTNQSIDAFFWRLFVPNPDTTPWLASDLLHRIGTALTSAVVLIALYRVVRRERGATEPAPVTGVTLALCAATVLARVSWEYMFVLGLPAFLVAFRAAWHPARPRWLALLGLAYLLCALPLPYTRSPAREGLALLLEAPRLYGMLLLIAVMVWTQERAFSAKERGGDSA